MTLSYNRISNIMTKMIDGGGIYVNGYTNDNFTNVISHNWVDHDQPNRPRNGAVYDVVRRYVCGPS